MSMTSITIKLSDAAFERARRAARILNQSIEEVLQSTLDTALPVLEDAPDDLAVEMASLPTLTDAELWNVARSRMQFDRESRLHELLDLQSEQPLSSEETRELELLRREAGRLILLKSQAYALLQQRGYPVPQP